ncbi:MAG TPA: choice-of-anchor tandem repeat GloVer-containing protein [Bryocella sp.]|nr:choice-of-anchor tandem repeat GloVer-containing protein [Bryocella sp.]
MPSSKISQLRVIAFTLFALTALVAAPTQAQTFTVLHQFGGANDGSAPEGLVAVDHAGNVYGSTPDGGVRSGPCAPLSGCGMAFRSQNHDGVFVYAPLYLFHGSDGANPFGGVTLGPDGALYGTTSVGGNTSCGNTGCGVVFRMTPPPTFCRQVFCDWDETVIYSNPGGDGPSLFYAGVVFDAAGNIYGASYIGGQFGNGAVYELSPSGGGNYTETNLYSFTGGSDGALSMTGVARDAAGDIYGATTQGGAYRYGTVFKLVHEANGYTFQLLYTFTGGSDGGSPNGNVVLDAAGNLYGATSLGGGIFQITPSGTFTVIDTQAGFMTAPLTIDALGNIYGTTYGGGSHDDGSVFELSNTNGTWTHNVLYSFTGQNDGALPISGVGMDASGNLYGTSTYSGTYGQGTLWQLTH